MKISRRRSGSRAIAPYTKAAAAFALRSSSGVFTGLAATASSGALRASTSAWRRYLSDSLRTAAYRYAFTLAAGARRERSRHTLRKTSWTMSSAAGVSRVNRQAKRIRSWQYA